MAASTQAGRAVARAAGVHLNTISSFELGSRSPRQASLDLIGDALERRGIEFRNGDEPGVILRPIKAVVPR